MRPKATYVALLGSAQVLRHLKIVKSGCQESSSFFPGVYALPGTGTHAWRNISLSIQYAVFLFTIQEAPFSAFCVSLEKILSRFKAVEGKLRTKKSAFLPIYKPDISGDNTTPVQRG